MIYIVGLGPGSKEYIVSKAIEVMESVELIIGFQRAIESIDFIRNNKIIIKSLKEINNYIGKDIAIIASGDPNFFGITDFIKKNIHEEVTVIPGITSFQYLMSRVNMSWSNSFVGSMHGREGDFIEEVSKHRRSIWLCDNKNTPQKLCNRLISNNVNCRVIVGENLSYKDERILVGEPGELITEGFLGLSVIVVENKGIGENDVY